MARRTWCLGGPRRCTSRTTASHGPCPSRARLLPWAGRRCMAATRFSAAYREQANARTDTGQVYGRTVAQASDDHPLSSQFASTGMSGPASRPSPKFALARWSARANYTSTTRNYWRRSRYLRSCSLSCDFVAYRRHRRLRFVTVRLRQLSRAACPAGQGPESVTGRDVSEGVCHEAS